MHICDDLCIYVMYIHAKTYVLCTILLPCTMTKSHEPPTHPGLAEQPVIECSTDDWAPCYNNGKVTNPRNVDIKKLLW